MNPKRRRFVFKSEEVHSEKRFALKAELLPCPIIMYKGGRLCLPLILSLMYSIHAVVSSLIHPDLLQKGT